MTIPTVHWFEQTNADGQGRHLGPTPDVETVEDALDVTIDGTGADREPLSDLCVGESTDDEPRYLALRWRQIAKTLRGRSVHPACTVPIVESPKQVRSVHDQAEPPTYGIQK